MNMLPVIALGGGALLLMSGGKKSGGKKKRLLRELADATGNPDFNPDSRDIDQIINELSLVLGTEPDKWTPQLEEAIRQMIQEFRA